MADLGQLGFSASQVINQPAKSIAGTVTDHAGQPARRLVRLHDRATGAIRNEGYSRASDGHYELASTLTGEAAPHYVVFFDDDAGDQYNALVMDRVVPA